MSTARFSERLLPELFIAVLLVLAAFGMLVTFSASVFYAQDVLHNRWFFVQRELAWLGIGCLAGLIAFRVHYQTVQRYSYHLFGLAIVLLALVLMPGIGRTANNASRWLSFGGLTVQPSEFAKYAVIIFVANWLSRNRRHLHRFVRCTVPLLVVVLIPTLLILKEPDLGTPVVIVATVMLMLFIAGVPLRHLALIVASAVPPLIALVWFVPYRMRRLIVFLNPDADPLNTGFQIRQSLIAIGSGKINGVGLGMSVQKKHYLPEAHTDFAFAIIGEELGFVGAALTLLLFLMLFIVMYAITRSIKDMFGHLVAAGIMSMLALQTLINVGVVTGCLPTKGLALPFISYGGSSLVMTLAACGLLLNIMRNQRNLRVETGTVGRGGETIV